MSEIARAITSFPKVCHGDGHPIREPGLTDFAWERNSRCVTTARRQIESRTFAYACGAKLGLAKNALGSAPHKVAVNKITIKEGDWLRLTQAQRISLDNYCKTHTITYGG